MAGLRLSSPAGCAGIPRETRKPRARRPPLRSGRERCRTGLPAVWVIATKAAVGAADPRKDITMATNDDPEFEPVHDASQTDHALTELQLYGHRPFQDEDPRPLPEGEVIAGAVVDIFDALVSALTDTRLE